MYFCFVEESGCPGPLVSSNAPEQPVFALCGYMINREKIRQLTYDFLDVKKQYSPGNAKAQAHKLDNLLWEIKGKEIRGHIRKSGRRARRNVQWLLRKIVSMSLVNDIKVVGLVWVKRPGGVFKGRSIYTKSLQMIAECFHRYLVERDSDGLILLDSRRQEQNIVTTHSLFTKIYSTNNYNRLIETPVFANSKNHAMLQIADMITSGLVFPLAVNAYCRGYVSNIHVTDSYNVLAYKYGAMLRSMQYSYQLPSGKIRGGIHTIDFIANRRSVDLFFPVR